MARLARNHPREPGDCAIAFAAPDGKQRSDVLEVDVVATDCKAAPQMARASLQIILTQRQERGFAIAVDEPGCDRQASFEEGRSLLELVVRDQQLCQLEIPAVIVGV